MCVSLQSAMLGNGLVLQNLLHMQLAQQQLLHIKDKRISSVRLQYPDHRVALVERKHGCYRRSVCFLMRTQD